MKSCTNFSTGGPPPKGQQQQRAITNSNEPPRLLLLLLRLVLYNLHHNLCHHLVIRFINQATTFWFLPLLQCWSGQGEGGQPDDERLGRLKGVEQAMARPR